MFLHRCFLCKAKHMTHARQDIREQIAEHLRTEFANVFTSRAKVLFDQDLPALLVYTTDETVQKERWDFDGFGHLFRELNVAVEGVDIGKDDLDNKLDAMAETIESLLDGWTMPNRQNAVLRFKSTETDMNIDGSKIYAAIKLTFTITYQTETHSDEH